VKRSITADSAVDAACRGGDGRSTRQWRDLQGIQRFEKLTYAILACAADDTLCNHEQTIEILTLAPITDVQMLEEQDRVAHSSSRMNRPSGVCLSRICDRFQRLAPASVSGGLSDLGDGGDRIFFAVFVRDARATPGVFGIQSSPISESAHHHPNHHDGG
jgi:hypothetical protein